MDFNFNNSSSKNIAADAIAATLDVARAAFRKVKRSRSAPMSSGVIEELNIGIATGIEVNHGKKFKNQTAVLDYGVIVWTSEPHGDGETVITNATWDRVGNFVTLTKAFRTGYVPTKGKFQQRIKPADGSKIPNEATIIYADAVKP